MSSWEGLNGPRVFWPGDELPIGIVVMGRDGSVAHVKFSGVKVRDYRDDTPLVEVVLPDWEKTVLAAGPRRVDPTGCGCTDCILGQWSQPLDRVSYQTLQRLIAGQVQNATGLGPCGLEAERVRRWESFRQMLDM